MKFIKRIPITAGMISGEQAQQTDLWYTNEAGALVAVAPWVSGQNVSTGNRRSHDQKVWQALSTHASTAEPDTAPTLWAFVGPTNRWAAFDDAVGSAIQETGSLSFTLTPGQRFDSFGVLGMVGGEVKVYLAAPDLPVGEFWTNAAISDPYVVRSMVSGGGALCAFSGYRAHKTTDGTSWLTYGLPFVNTDYPVYFNGLFVAAGWYSSDCVNWTNSGTPLYGRTFNAGGVLIHTYQGKIYRSLNGQSWTLVAQFPYLEVNKDSFAAQGSTLFLMGDPDYGFVFYVSTDNGLTWAAPSGMTAPVQMPEFGNGLWLSATAHGSSENYQTSVDGVNWTNRSLPSTGFYYGDIAFADGLFVVCTYGYGSSSSIIHRSTNGITWLSSSVPGFLPYKANLVKAGGLWFASLSQGGENARCYSTDAANWQLCTFQGKTGEARNRPAYIYNRWVLVEGYSYQYGQVSVASAWVSDNGKNWVQKQLPSPACYDSLIGAFDRVFAYQGSYYGLPGLVASAGREFYSTTIPLIEDAEPVIDFWTYCFAGFKQKEDLIVTGLNSASYTNASINITINGATISDPVKLGTFNFGMVQVLGITEMGMKTGITNYSTYDVDSFGVTRITPRSFAKKINANVAVEREKYNTVYRALIEVKDTAVIVFPSDSDDYSEATTYGHIREWSLSIDYPTYTMLPIEVRGLT